MTLELLFTRVNGTTAVRSIPLNASAVFDELSSPLCGFVSISDQCTRLSRLQSLVLSKNAFTDIPRHVCHMTTLRSLSFGQNRLASITPHIEQLVLLEDLWLSDNDIRVVPRELCTLPRLAKLALGWNSLSTLPPELVQLRCLRIVLLNDNHIDFLPLEWARMRERVEVRLERNDLPVTVNANENVRPRFDEIFAATRQLSMIRARATAICVALQELELPALVTLEIIDAAMPNSIKMASKWDLIVAVKHFN